MTAKSIIDIDLRDDKFKEFLAVYNKFEKSTKSLPDAWAAVNAKIDGSRSSFDKMVSKMVAQNIQSKLHLKAQQEADRLTQTSAERWQSMSRSTKDVAANIGRATASLLKWTALTSVFSGLLGAGGLFGIDRMAGSVAQGRRSSLGLGISQGAKSSFEVNYGQMVDPGSFLGGVNESLTDVTKRRYLYGAGLSDRDLASNDTGKIAPLLLRKIEHLVDQTPTSQLGQLLSSRGLDQFGLGVEDLRRMKETPASERAKNDQRFIEDQKQLALDREVQDKWKDLTVQLDRAGRGIFRTFVTGLAPLEKPIEKLSSSFEKVVESFSKSDVLQKWIGDLETGLETFASYIGKPEFQNDIRDFVGGVGNMASAIARFVKWFGGSPAASSGETVYNAPGSTTPATPGAQYGYRVHRGWFGLTWNERVATGGDGSSDTRNNPGNLREPGKSTGFASFPTEDAGLRAMARQLRIYGNRDHLDTIQGIIGKYAPASENDVGSYVKDVSRRTGFEPNQHLDLNNNATLAALMAAMTKHENSRSNFSSKTIIEVLNNTGGSAVVTTNQVSQP